MLRIAMAISQWFQEFLSSIFGHLSDFVDFVCDTDDTPECSRRRGNPLVEGIGQIEFVRSMRISCSPPVRSESVCL